MTGLVILQRLRQIDRKLYRIVLYGLIPLFALVSILGVAFAFRGWVFYDFSSIFIGLHCFCCGLILGVSLYGMKIAPVIAQLESAEA